LGGKNGFPVKAYWVKLGKKEMDGESLIVSLKNILSGPWSVDLAKRPLRYLKGGVEGKLKTARIVFFLTEEIRPRSLLKRTTCLRRKKKIGGGFGSGHLRR